MDWGLSEKELPLVERLIAEYLSGSISAPELIRAVFLI
jgi:hypothetical protein